jgi:hypothetical protein
VKAHIILLLAHNPERTGTIKKELCTYFNIASKGENKGIIRHLTQLRADGLVTLNDRTKLNYLDDASFIPLLKFIQNLEAPSVFDEKKLLSDNGWRRFETVSDITHGFSKSPYFNHMMSKPDIQKQIKETHKELIPSYLTYNYNQPEARISLACESIIRRILNKPSLAEKEEIKKELKQNPEVAKLVSKKSKELGAFLK